MLDFIPITDDGVSAGEIESLGHDWPNAKFFIRIPEKKTESEIRINSYSIRRNADSAIEIIFSNEEVAP